MDGPEDKGRNTAWRLRPPGARAHQQRDVDRGDDGPQWPVYVMLSGVFGILLIFLTIGQLTLISFPELARWFALFGFAGNLVPVRLYAKAMTMDRIEWFWFNLLAVGPWLLGTGLVVNFFFHGPEQRMLVQLGHDFDLHAYWLHHGELPPHQPWPADPCVGRHGAPMDREMIGQGGVVLGLAQGALGYLVISSRHDAADLITAAPVRVGQRFCSAQIDRLLGLKGEALAQPAGLAHHGAFGTQLQTAAQGASQQKRKRVALPLGEGGP